MTHFWYGRIHLLTERDGQKPEIELSLDGNLSLVGVTYPPLPRTGETYWLIDDETFRRSHGLPDNQPRKGINE